MARWRGFVRSADTLWTSAPTVAWLVTRPAVDDRFCGPDGSARPPPQGRRLRLLTASTATVSLVGLYPSEHSLLRLSKFTHKRIII